ncbi:hypothetical protein J437_LFUL018949 [Ladona fulva]|uniref:PiggyBac transposable element-derived protein 4 C-terminal zinc-finger domain-containing protein n=1 Tax=Ladona fulva TaxID=123851 RepID=A0A8K0KS22_LADFU|nr:hypothetical protein J437_LFUL018949 [Ladona fulva]
MHTFCLTGLVEFRESIMRKLMKTESLAKKKIIRKSTEKVHLPTYIKGDAKAKTKRRKCRLCLQNKIRKDVSFHCATCSDEPALCLEPCFRLYHKY